VEDGMLVKKAETGYATLRATVEGTDLYTEVVVFLTDRETDVTVVQMQETNDGYLLALLDDGTLWFWGNGVLVPQQLPFENVKQFFYGIDYYKVDPLRSKNYMYVLHKDGLLDQFEYTLNADSSEPILSNVYNGGQPMKNVAKIEYTSYNGYSWYALLTDGTAFAWGSNEDGELGDGSATNRYMTPVQMEMTGLKDLVPSHDRIYLLDQSGKVYWYGDGYTEAILEAEDVDRIYRTSITYETYAAMESENVVRVHNGGDDTERRGQWDHATENSYFYVENDETFVTTSGNAYGQAGIGKTGSNYGEYEPVLNVGTVRELFATSYNTYFQTTGKFYSAGRNNESQLGNLTEGSYSAVPNRVYFGIDATSGAPKLALEGIVDGVLTLDADQGLRRSSDYALISLKDSNGETVSTSKSVKLDKFFISPVNGWIDGETYTVTIPENALINVFGVAAAAETFTVTAEETEEVALMSLFAEEEEEVRFIWTVEKFHERWEEYLESGPNPQFYHNAILNRLVREDKVETEWLRLQAYQSSDRDVVSVTGNYWGTTSESLINKQIVDFDDYQQYANLNHAGYLTEAPEDVWPFAVKAGLIDKTGTEVDVIGNELVTFYVEFNRDMDTSIELDVRFGSYYPYADYAVEGQWVSARRWEGTTTLTTLIEGGYQYWSIDNGRAADAPLKLYKDWGRFQFEIDTTEALAMVLQGNATNTGIQLTWYQDDFATLAGYNVYRADEDEDAYYQRINDTIIPVGTEEFFDDTVEPGKVYYYIFKVVQTDLQESDASGKIMIMSKDTMAPDLYHTPVYHTYAGSNLVISAVATDNLQLQSVQLHYRTAGSEAWTSVEMASLNDKYSAVIGSNAVTTDGLEYYITAFDGVTITTRGTSTDPFTVVVQAPLDQDALGDVDGDGSISIVDALMVLQAKNDRITLEKDEFDRADLNGDGLLSAAEALKILRYANGEIGSLK